MKRWFVSALFGLRLVAYENVFHLFLPVLSVWDRRRYSRDDRQGLKGSVKEDFFSNNASAARPTRGPRADANDGRAFLAAA